MATISVWHKGGASNSSINQMEILMISMKAQKIKTKGAIKYKSLGGQQRQVGLWGVMAKVTEMGTQSFQI